MNGIGPPPLNALPNGLLDFFGVKTGGHYPAHFVPGLVTSLDLWRHYVAMAPRTMELSAGPVLVAATTDSGTLRFPSTAPVDVGDGTDIIVPSFEVWIVDYFSISWTLTNAADRGSVVPGITPSGGAASIRLPCFTGGETQGRAAPTVTSGWASLSQPFIARPGSRLIGITSGFTITGGSNVVAQIRILPMRG